jgi:cytochrome c oxidase subunit II
VGAGLHKHPVARHDLVAAKLIKGARKTMLRQPRLIAMIAAAIFVFVGGGALAGIGQPSRWQMGLQQSVTPVMDDIVWFHTFLLYLIAAVSVFVLVLLLIVVFRFNAKANPTPSKTTHNTTIEVLWTVVPVLILVAIAVPSFRLLFLQTTIPPADLTVKAIGQQWYWQYDYPDSKFEFSSNMLQDSERKGDQPRLLAVDNELVVPINKVVRVLVTADATGVIHAFAVPSFGVKIDAVPGRINETWFKANREGIYYGQCSELCGRNHAYMPIAVRVVSDQEFATWLEQAKKKYARDDGARSTNIAAAAE